MTKTSRPAPGTIAWHDLTAKDAGTLRDFYAHVTGWRPEPVDMGSYEDFNMCLADGSGSAAGICHARGSNPDLPAQWLMYIVVAELDSSLETCRRKGGQVVSGPRHIGEARFAVIRDPAGAVCALYQPAP